MAFGLAAGPAPNRFLVSLCVLGLFAEAAEDRPLVCIVDDAQWLDRASAQVLGFVARRVLAERVALVFAVRECGGQSELAGLPELVVEGLDDTAARALLTSVIAGRLDEQVVERIVAEARGNPLALLEMPRGLSEAELAGGFGVSSRLPLPARLEEGFLRRLRALPAPTQRLLLVAAAEPVGDPALLWRAAGRLDLGVAAAAPAEAADLLELGARVRFRHALVRSAVYGAATFEDRQRAHQALAESTDAMVDPDRRAWHLAEAALGPDAEIADDLERSADRALARGGVAAAAAFLERASVLSPEPAALARRALAAGQAKLLAGAPKAALTLLARAEAGPLDAHAQAVLDRLRGQIAAHLRCTLGAPTFLPKAARGIEAFDAGLARDTYLEALWTAIVAGRFGDGLPAVAQAARAVRPPAQPRAADVLLDGLAKRFTDGFEPAVPTLKRALQAFRTEEIRSEQELGQRILALRTAVDLLDDDALQALATHNVQAARDIGALTVLPVALIYLGLRRPRQPVWP
jgi:hypothetical protein